MLTLLYVHNIPSEKEMHFPSVKKSALPALNQHLPNQAKYTNLFICMCPIEFMNVKVFQIQMQLLLAQFTSCYCFQRRTWWGGAGRKSVSSCNSLQHNYTSITNCNQFLALFCRARLEEKKASNWNVVTIGYCQNLNAIECLFSIQLHIFCLMFILDTIRLLLKVWHKIAAWAVRILQCNPNIHKSNNKCTGIA